MPLRLYVATKHAGTLEQRGYYERTYETCLLETFCRQSAALGGALTYWWEDHRASLLVLPAEGKASRIPGDGSFTSSFVSLMR